VGQVRLEAGPDGLRVAGVELGAASVLSRLRTRPVGAAGAPVPLASVHLLSPRAHAVQLSLPGAMVFGVDPTGMAEVVTRTSVAHAREILQAADRAVVEEALALLHPHVRERVTGAVAPRRRGRRLRGWRLHRPGPQHRPRGGDGRG
jgi:hypothetical protein